MRLSWLGWCLLLTLQVNVSDVAAEIQTSLPDVKRVVEFFDTKQINSNDAATIAAAPAHQHTNNWAVLVCPISLPSLY